jgi:hypothetical protein
VSFLSTVVIDALRPAGQITEKSFIRMMPCLHFVSSPLKQCPVVGCQLMHKPAAIAKKSSISFFRFTIEAYSLFYGLVNNRHFSRECREKVRSWMKNIFKKVIDGLRNNFPWMYSAHELAKALDHPMVVSAFLVRCFQSCIWDLAQRFSRNLAEIISLGVW